MSQNKMILVTGGSGSGKSAFAEECIVKSRLPHRYYFATMKVWGEEDVKKIERHRVLRAGKGFETIEEAVNVGAKVPEIKQHPAAVLLECMSNLTANVMFERETPRTPQEVCAKILPEIAKLKASCELLVVVSNNIFEDGITYDPSTQSYMEALAQMNRELAQMADEIYEVVVGIPLRIS